ncbi:hypothetical protein BCR43DRAFT_199823 [Syncephalastrum racemosum]|uniref:Uncharacterized protein n=1 Tax=Syncephalastrum racemosum TaxID=13706 RepID=A0A1X2HHP8_SYNRA|nr:hypothetical protein BCR43DRAFT_199823 [Syncephalastrum racemosum]
MSFATVTNLLEMFDMASILGVETDALANMGTVAADGHERGRGAGLGAGSMSLLVASLGLVLVVDIRGQTDGRALLAYTRHVFHSIAVVTAKTGRGTVLMSSGT